MTSAVVYFVQDATENLDMKYDALKIMNTDDRIPNIYTKSQNSNLKTQISNLNFAINGLPLSVLGSSVSQSPDYYVPLTYIVSKSGNYILSVEDLMNFDSALSICLVDTKENITYELARGKQIPLSLTPDNGENRFFIKFSTHNSQFSILNSQIFNCYSEGTDLIINYYNPS